MNNQAEPLWRWHKRPGHRSHLVYPSHIQGVFYGACDCVVLTDKRNNDPTSPCTRCLNDARGMLVGKAA